MSIDIFDWWIPIQGFSEELDNPEIPVEDGSKYKINSYGFRCDEFIKIHKKTHLLFSGCSNTYGIGLKKEETWAHQVYSKINEEKECSGYFNIAFSANNIINSILNIFKYCKKFGNPDIIFINFPSHSRFFNFNEKSLQYHIIDYKNFDQSYYINKLTVYNYYLILEQYCKTNNIKLFSFSWDIHDQYFFNKKKKIIFETTNDLFAKYNFKTFYYINPKNIFDEMFLLKEKHDNYFFDIARDNKHRGNGIHLYWSNFIYNKYLESKFN